MKRILILCIAAALLLLPAAAFAAGGQQGVITGTNVNLRHAPTTASARLRYLNTGDAVTVTDTLNGWYAVVADGQSGYVYAQYVRLTSAGTANLTVGSRGDAVKTLQQRLILLGCLNGAADGIFGSQTRAAVLRYQRANGLKADGIAGTLTRSAVAAEAERVNTVVATARSFLGTAYAYGGSSPKTGFDCSGLVQWAHAQAGISVPRVSYEQAASGAAVSRAQLRAGDVVCFNSPVSHVGIYVGGGKFIHSPKTNDVVKITNLSAMNLTQIRRYTGTVA